MADKGKQRKATVVPTGGGNIKEGSSKGGKSGKAVPTGGGNVANDRLTKNSGPNNNILSNNGSGVKGKSLISNKKKP